MRARDIMTSPVITVTPDTPARAAALMLISHGFAALPVVDEDGRLVGMVSEADVVRGCCFDERPRTVAQVMTPAVLTADAAAPAPALARVLVDGESRYLPIVDCGVVVGVVTQRDLVRAVTRKGASVTANVQRLLDVYGGGSEWTVTVREGTVVIAGGDVETGRVLTDLVGAVSGVVGVRLTTGVRLN